LRIVPALASSCIVSICSSTDVADRSCAASYRAVPNIGTFRSGQWVWYRPT
jgi:hypothetical protein